jgi:UDP-N-acetylmuramoylalanine--D-glutamate ligase
VVCITGTKGKSTTTSVLGHLLRGLGHRVLTCGNLGTAPYDPEVDDDQDWWVVEVSSYQAADVGVSAPVTVVTSLHPDHLPWHGGDVERYYADKLAICHQPGAEVTVANGDSDLLRARSGQLGPRVRWVGVGDEPIERWTSELGLLGAHNYRNALLARAALEELGVLRAGASADEAGLRRAATGFVPLESRLTPVGSAGGVLFVDDSLSTNVLPTLAAVDAFPHRRVALLVGGADRDIDYEALAAGLSRRAGPLLVVVLDSESGPRIAAALAGRADVRPGGDMAAAVALAHDWARPDGVVLLSPAAPSFDRYRDYHAKAAAFRAAVDDLP